MTIIVTNQEELDAAVESCFKNIIIDSPPDVWLELRKSPYVVVQGHSRVEARELSIVHAWGDCCINASPDVIVYIHSERALVTGGMSLKAEQ